MKKVFIVLMCAVIAVTFCIPSAAVDAALLKEYVKPSSLNTDLTYDESKFLQPYWYGNIVYYETVLPVENADGSISPIDLMYKADEIISVKIGDITPGTYEQGVDYELNNKGQLVILPGGKINTIPYSSFYFKTSPTGIATWQRNSGGYILAGGGASMMSKQLQISYIHSDSWQGPVPENKSSLIPLTTAKLEDGEDVNIAFYGDSITTGLISTKANKIYPNCPGWAEMAYDALCTAYPIPLISYINYSVGGWQLDNAYANRAQLCSQDFDLIVLAFGMNDCYSTHSVSRYITILQSIMDSVRASNPDVEFVVVSAMIPNSQECYAIKDVADYIRELREGFLARLEGEGVAVVDVTSVSEYILTLKSFSDMTENNINHPNDFMARAYAQTFAATVIGNDKLEETFGYYLSGDIDNNGIISLDEARMILRASVGLETLSAAETGKADMNGDDEVSAADARMMLQMTLS